MKHISRILLGLILLFAFFTGGYAQVTIGQNEEPQKGALLDLKEYESKGGLDGNNADRGLLYPRVNLTSITELYPMFGSSLNEDPEYASKKNELKKKHTGLIVYNTNASHPVGLLMWNGEAWRKIDHSPIIVPEIESLSCGSVSMTPARYEQGIPFDGIISLAYTGGNGGYYDAQPNTIEDITGSLAAMGLRVELLSGKLSYGAGKVLMRVWGVPTSSSPDPITFAFNFLGKTCFIKAGDLKEIKFIEYAKKTVPVDANTPTASITEIGNLKVQYDGDNPNNSQFIKFSTAVPSHVTWTWTKHGSGGVNTVSWGRKACLQGTWYRFHKKDTDQYQSTGTVDNSSADINFGNRDIADAIIVLHNTQEVYRVRFNANGYIGASGSIPAVSPTITLFVELLD